MKSVSRIQTALPALLLTVLLAACAPAITAGGAEHPEQRAVLINAPFAGVINGLADHLEQSMRAQPHCCDFGFQFAMPVRFQETHRDMVAERAPRSAAALTRNLGGTWPVMVAADVLQRTVTEGRGSLIIRASVSVRAIVLDDQANELATFTTPVQSGVRRQSSSEELPDESVDPLVVSLAFDAAEQLSADLTVYLNSLVPD